MVCSAIGRMIENSVDLQGLQARLPAPGLWELALQSSAREASAGLSLTVVKRSALVREVAVVWEQLGASEILRLRLALRF